jgi:hypothetical protein
MMMPAESKTQALARTVTNPNTLHFSTNAMYCGVCTAISRWRWDFSTFWVKSLRADLAVPVPFGPRWRFAVFLISLHLRKLHSLFLKLYCAIVSFLLHCFFSFPRFQFGRADYAATSFICEELYRMAGAVSAHGFITTTPVLDTLPASLPILLETCRREGIAVITTDTLIHLQKTISS